MAFLSTILFPSSSSSHYSVYLLHYPERFLLPIASMPAWVFALSHFLTQTVSFALSPFFRYHFFFTHFFHFSIFVSWKFYFIAHDYYIDVDENHIWPKVRSSCLPQLQVWFGFDVFKALPPMPLEWLTSKGVPTFMRQITLLVLVYAKENNNVYCNVYYIYYYQNIAYM